MMELKFFFDCVLKKPLRVRELCVNKKFNKLLEKRMCVDESKKNKRIIIKDTHRGKCENYYMKADYSWSATSEIYNVEQRWYNTNKLLKHTKALFINLKFTNFKFYGVFISVDEY